MLSGKFFNCFFSRVLSFKYLIMKWKIYRFVDKYFMTWLKFVIDFRSSTQTKNLMFAMATFWKVVRPKYLTLYFCRPPTISNLLETTQRCKWKIKAMPHPRNHDLMEDDFAVFMWNLTLKTILASNGYGYIYIKPCVSKWSCSFCSMLFIWLGYLRGKFLLMSL